MSPEIFGTKVINDTATKPKLQRLRVEVRRGDDKGAVFDLDCEPIRIGTSPGCDVLLTDPTVSGVHAELRRSTQGIFIHDLGSTNGTFVERYRVTGIYAQNPVTIRLGTTELKVTPLREEAEIELLPDGCFGDLVGSSVAMRAIFSKLARIAESDSTVLLTGETGTGKELAAAAIRDHSKRRRGPLVVIDCGALPANLIESELFGHERGAFTGADRIRAGAFERANGGTIFLDEIGELPLGLQPALLGVLERRESRRVGGEKPIAVDVRVITATNRDLALEVARGAFRADLYYRLAVVEVRLPPLRERTEDLPLLIEHLLSQLPGEKPTLTPETIKQLKTYSWPGNVRELRNVIERAALLSELPQTQSTLKATKDIKDYKNVININLDEPFKDAKNALVDEFEKSYIKELLEVTKGNIAAAARKARIDRMYLYKLLDRHQIEAPLRVRE